MSTKSNQMHPDVAHKIVLQTLEQLAPHERLELGEWMKQHYDGQVDGKEVYRYFRQSWLFLIQKEKDKSFCSDFEQIIQYINSQMQKMQKKSSQTDGEAPAQELLCSYDEYLEEKMTAFLDGSAQEGSELPIKQETWAKIDQKAGINAQQRKRVREGTSFKYVYDASSKLIDQRAPSGIKAFLMNLLYAAFPTVPHFYTEGKISLDVVEAVWTWLNLNEQRQGKRRMIYNGLTEYQRRDIDELLGISASPTEADESLLGGKKALYDAIKYICEREKLTLEEFVPNIDIDMGTWHAYRKDWRAAEKDKKSAEEWAWKPSRKLRVKHLLLIAVLTELSEKEVIQLFKLAALPYEEVVNGAVISYFKKAADERKAEEEDFGKYIRKTFS